MDYEALVNEILTRVMAKLRELELTAAQASCCQTDNTCRPENTQSVSKAEPAVAAKKEKQFTKRVVTERDLYAARNEGVNQIVIKEETIMTDLAKEYAAKYGIAVIRS
ncbi:MAG: hypothetical protein Q4F74_03440 [Synergistaceae bacterium]|nr:hypothetical protein [Synergistaceae bacterium]